MKKIKIEELIEIIGGSVQIGRKNTFSILFDHFLKGHK